MFIEILAKRRVYSSQSIKTVNLIDKKKYRMLSFQEILYIIEINHFYET